MRLGLCALTGECLRTIVLNERDWYSVGGGSNDAIQIDGLPERCAIVERQGEGLQIRAVAGAFVVDGREEGACLIRCGEGAMFVCEDHRVVLRAFVADDEAPLSFSLWGCDEVAIGRAGTSTVVLKDSHISNRHALLSRKGGVWWIADQNSSNGVYLNGKRVERAELQAGDVIQLMHYAIHFDGRALQFANANGVISFSRAVKRPTPPPPPRFRRSPRIPSPQPTGEIDIQRPPSKQEKPEINWLPILLQPLILVTTSVLLGYVIARSSGNYLYMFASIPFGLASVLVASLNYRSQIKRFQARETLREDTYRKYLLSKQKEIEACAQAQRDALEHVHPDPATCLRIGMKLERRLWERSPNDDDFLLLRAGRSDQALAAKINLHAQTGVELDRDPLNDWPEKLAETFRAVESLPFTVDFRQHAAIGVTGDRTSAIGLLRCLLLQLAVHHSFEDTRLICLYDERESNDWDWMRFLPHVWDGNCQSRMMASSMAAGVHMLDRLHEALKLRQRFGVRAGDASPLPHYVLILADPYMAQGHEVMNLLQTARDDLGISVVYLSKSLREVPGSCSLLLRCEPDNGLCIDRLVGGTQTAFRYDAVSASDLDPLSRRLFSVKIDSYGGQMDLPDSISFLQGYGVHAPREIPIAQNWREHAAHRSLSAPIGVLAGGKIFSLDAHEKAHGPHGLIAGTTGSGKSEMILSWLLSMAVNYHPHEVVFLLIDYKGGGMADLLRELPHTVGCITNIDEARISRSLISLQSEIQRRLTLLRNAGVNHIDRYLERRSAGASLDALPHLFLIVDEFGELKRDQPDFMQALISAARVGRSVGIHLVLATQKPSGLVDDQIWSNARFKLCLKVQDVSDSREMLHRNDAALITTPGRAYVQVGHDEIFELVQTFWSSAVFAEGQSTYASTAALVALDGQRKRLHWDETRDVHTEIAALTREIARVAANLGIEPLPGLWLPELPPQISLDEIAEPRYRHGEWPGKAGPRRIPVGLYDDPVAQKQALLYVDLEEIGHLGIYGAPGSGKTTLMKTFLLSVFTQFAPDEAQAYMLDLGGYGLSSLAHFPHVGASLTGADEEEAEKVLDWLLTELERRKRLLAESGVSTVSAYRAASGQKLPSILVAIDNFPAVFEIFEQLDSCLVILTREGASAGIHLIYTSNGTAGIRYKVLQNIRGALALSMSDAGEYNSIVGSIGKRPFALPPGRGYTKGRETLEFLAALPVFGSDEATRTAAMRALSFEMARHWRGDLPFAVRTLPETLRYSDIAPAAREGFLPLGLDTDEIAPTGLALERFHCAALSCTTFDAGAQLLAVALRGVPEGAMIVAFDSQQILRPLVPHAYRLLSFERDPEAIASVMRELADMLDERKDAAESGGTFAPIYLLVADLPRFIETVAESERDILERIARMGEGLGVYVLALGLAPEWAHWKEIETLARALTVGGVGAAIGGVAGDHAVFADALRPMRDKRLEGHFAAVIESGQAHRIRMADERELS